MQRTELTIEHQYKLYLQRGGVKEQDMPPDQRYEIKRAFYGGVVQALIMFRDDLIDYCGGDDDKAVEVLESLMNEGESFWENEVTKEAEQIEEITEYRRKTFKSPSAIELASALFNIHSHAEIEHERNPAQIVYREDEIIDLLKKFGFPIPDWDGFGVTITKGI